MNAGQRNDSDPEAAATRPPSEAASDARIGPETGIEAASRAAARLLVENGDASDVALRDARRLVCAASGRSPMDLIAAPGDPLGGEAAARLADMLERRRRSEPVSRILGEREFYGRVFEVTPATLDPRPDTETLIDVALEIVGSGGSPSGLEIDLLDIGTGTGCIALTLLAELPGARATATDICPEALAVARRNAERHGLAGRLQLLECDALDEVDGRYHLILSNPPYIADAEMAGLERAVRDFDPEKALRGGTDGLDLYRRIIRAAPSRLNMELGLGWLILEVGATQAEAVAALLSDAGFEEIRTNRDLAGHARTVAGRTRR